MTNFDFLKSDGRFDGFADVAIKAENLLHIDVDSCVSSCRRAMEFAVKWMYSVDRDLVTPYQDTLVSLMNDEKFKDGVTTIFSNDHDNTAKLGKGADKEYRERHDGRPMDAKLTKGRYVRCYSNGSTSEPVNNYIEIEVFGK